MAYLQKRGSCGVAHVGAYVKVHLVAPRPQLCRGVACDDEGPSWGQAHERGRGHTVDTCSYMAQLECHAGSAWTDEYLEQSGVHHLAGTGATMAWGLGLGHRMERVRPLGV